MSRQWPLPKDTYRISSRFEGRTNPVTGVAEHHSGTDMAAHDGTPFYACADGTVLYIGAASGYGQWIVLDHDDAAGGGVTEYGHMWDAFATGLQVGDKVQRGQLIGYVGSNGQATGPHLHLTVWQRQYGGVRVDPETWLSGAPYPPVGGGKAEAGTAPAPGKEEHVAETIFGVDVSRWQNGMSLKRVKDEGFQFAILRTNDGTIPDECYQSHYADAQDAGLLMAAYTYVHGPQDGASIAEQVNTSLRVMGSNRLPMWLDVEAPSGLAPSHIKEFADRFEAAGVRVIGVYTYGPYWAGNLIGPDTPNPRSFGSGGHFWFAGYPGGPGFASTIYSSIGGDGAQQWVDLTGGATPDIWQFSSTASVAGFNEVDVNAYRGSVESLRSLFYGGDAAGGDDDMSAEAERKIDAIYNQMTGSFTNGEYPGFDIDALYRAAAGKGFSRLTMMEGVAVVVRESLLTGDQLAGPGRDKDGNRTFGGWDVTSVLKVARARGFRGLTMAQMVLVSTFGTDEDRQAVAEQIGGTK